MNVILGALGDSTTVSACYAHAKDKEYIAARKQAEKDFFSGNGTSSAP